MYFIVVLVNSVTFPCRLPKSSRVGFMHLSVQCKSRGGHPGNGRGFHIFCRPVGGDLDIMMGPAGEAISI